MNNIDNTIAIQNMIKRQISSEVECSSQLLQALRSIPRSYFIPEEMQALAYSDADLYPYIPSPRTTAVFVHLVVDVLRERMPQKSELRVAVIACGMGYMLHLLDNMGVDAIGITSSPDDINRGIEIAEMLKNDHVLENNIKKDDVSFKKKKMRMLLQELFSRDIPSQPFDGIICCLDIDNPEKESQIEEIMRRNLLTECGRGVYLRRIGEVREIVGFEVEGGEFRKKGMSVFAMVG